MEWITVILAAAVVILLIILIFYKRQIRDICRQLAFLRENESNLLITRQMEAGSVGELADLLNGILEAQRRERKRYRKKEQELSDMYTNLSHDIRTPLTSLNGYFTLLSGSREEEERERYQRIIEERIESLKEMLEELFTYAKLRNEAYELEMEEVSLGRLVKETLFSYYEEWQERNIEPVIRIAEEEIAIRGNVPGLKRLIRNIIKNGLEHGRKEIRIFLTAEKGEAILRVANRADNPEEIDTDKVFERFYKADPARRRASTGLGLSIAKEFVKRMNGQIRAELLGNEFGIEVRFPISGRP